MCKPATKLRKSFFNFSHVKIAFGLKFRLLFHKNFHAAAFLRAPRIYLLLPQNISQAAHVYSFTFSLHPLFHSME